MTKKQKIELAWIGSRQCDQTTGGAGREKWEGPMTTRILICGWHSRQCVMQSPVGMSGDLQGVAGWLLQVIGALSLPAALKDGTALT